MTFGELCEFILLPGFTTNSEVTEYSGRGVGLDVVQNIIGKCRRRISGYRVRKAKAKRLSWMLSANAGNGRMYTV